MNVDGGIFNLQNTQFSDLGSKFKQNSAYSGGVISSSYSQITLYESEFEDNVAYEGGVIILDQNSNLDADYISMKRNYALGEAGCILARTGSEFTIQNSIFSNNQAQLGYSVLQALGTHNTNFLSFTSCTFKENQAPYTSLGCTFLDEKFDQEGIISISNNLAGAFIQIIVSVQLSIQFCTFTGGHSQYGGALYISDDSIVKIETSKFISNQADDYGGAIYGIGFQSLIISNDCQFIDNIAYSEGDDIYARNNNFNNSQEKLAGGGIICNDCPQVYIANSEFSRLKAQKGGCLYFTQSATNNIEFSYLIENSIFNECISTSGDGGAIYDDNIGNLTIRNSKFLNNFAFEKGGAIYFQC
ncbi:UNKNOWN [Stylonychia lemnae]|uniref:Pectin lyase fold/virulence factor n=1 Tax=Stylonychia lemnae TaxID=5949 RepID=A0A078B7R9_STYLE|nr:UNKNOWN [Stylonychia lemnae]|eukprot:CDW90560.1 UNKNOWN [Stylonychia lemnae]